MGNLRSLSIISTVIRNDSALPEESKDHASDCRGFHLGGDILIIYLISRDKAAVLLRIGSHAQLFK
ncbi:mRNA interferase YafQ [Bathymodiolus platifrons methanotrophic gill symbiont]|uniref:type II toxin-antitoxin system YafQ family toxin n=1 Tax=Bathymodiolus platifrons methanotrophic gill symbiont TaxID=113268 RepID=UPI001B3FA180|nr:type II toxin-antitoxin system YafQ family toxin [Bathymodiolus platifrons methanotrophic gill symbiont]GFO74495.1 mRNA interferase YafQ [Bathymodiolus platifrons methanotrophic gill symbiont]